MTQWLVKPSLTKFVLRATARAAKASKGLGKPFTTSDFVTSKSDAELLAFIKVGRPVGDPDNTTGIDMPPKGGNPALTDAQLMDVIAYIRTLHE